MLHMNKLFFREIRIVKEAQRRVLAGEEAWIQDAPVCVFGKECELRINITDECATYESRCFLRVRVFFTIRLNPICNYDVIWFIIYDIMYFFNLSVVKSS